MSIVGTRPPLISETNLYEPRHKVRNKKILKSRRFARNFACNRPDFMCELSEKVPPKQN